jgi:hypothetical protein
MRMDTQTSDSLLQPIDWLHESLPLFDDVMAVAASLRAWIPAVKTIGRVVRSFWCELNLGLEFVTILRVKLTSTLSHFPSRCLNKLLHGAETQK